MYLLATIEMLVATTILGDPEGIKCTYTVCESKTKSKYKVDKNWSWLANGK